MTDKVNPLEIIKKYYDPASELYFTLTGHSLAVADMAVEVAKCHPELNADIQFVYEAAMLHDIGIIRTNAPGIDCHGELPYICHGIAGCAMLLEEGLERHALVCERHTGAGLTKEEIIAGDIPLPHRDFLPVTIEEKIICYADKFFSKSRELSYQKQFDEVMKTMGKFGEATQRRFLELHEMLQITTDKI